VVNDTALWPMAFNKILRYGSERITKFCSVTHSALQNSALWSTKHNKILHVDLLLSDYGDIADAGLGLMDFKKHIKIFSF
jgi:hypothetical protein